MSSKKKKSAPVGRQPVSMTVWFQPATHDRLLILKGEYQRANGRTLSKAKLAGLALDALIEQVTVDIIRKDV